MKNLITTAMLWAVISMSLLNAQQNVKIEQYKYDTLHVVEQGQVLAQVIAPRIHQVKEDGNWKVLLEAFQKQMETVKEQIPVYEQYHIAFDRGNKLTIQEDLNTENVSRYNIASGEVIPVASFNSAVLLDQNIELRLYYTDLEDLYARNYMALISTAFEKMKTRPKIVQGIKDLYFPVDDLYYNSSSAQMEKGSLLFGNPKFVGFADFTVGVHRNDVALSLGYGLGLGFGRSGEQSLMVAINEVNQFDRETSKSQRIRLIGGVYRPFKAISFGYYAPLGKGNDFFDIKSRLTTTLYPDWGGKFSVNVNYTDTEEFYLGFDFGIPLNIGARNN